jgi:4a-hydroxytetrahydrobiopterin dehydratase
MFLKKLLNRLKEKRTFKVSNTKNKECESCRIDTQEITKEELAYMLPNRKHWILLEENGIKKIQRVYNFEDFGKAIKFTNKVSDLAEKHNHHPAIITEWGKVTITWWSHGIENLTIKDLDMAEGCDNLF